MFYKIIRFLVIGLFLLDLIFLIGFYAGMFDAGHILLFVRVFVISFGFYTFHRTRLYKHDQGWVRLVKLPFHFLILPVTVIGAFFLTSETFNQSYWVIVNSILVLSSAVALIDLIQSMILPEVVKFFMQVLSLALGVLLSLQMFGKFDSGKVILFGITGYLLLMFVIVFFIAKGKVKSR